MRASAARRSFTAMSVQPVASLYCIAKDGDAASLTLVAALVHDHDIVQPSVRHDPKGASLRERPQWVDS